MPYRLRVRHGFVRAGLASVLVTGSVLLLHTASAHATIRVSQDAPRAALWEQLYDKLPSWWKTRRTVAVREVSDQEMDRLVASDQHRTPGALKEEDSVVDGYYQSGGDDGTSATITLRKSLRSEAAELVFVHEYGHFVWDERINGEDRGEYRRVWARQRRARRLVTDYAADSAEEGFAEAFAYYLRRPNQLQHRDEDSFRYLKDLSARFKDAERPPAG